MVRPHFPCPSPDPSLRLRTTIAIVAFDQNIVCSRSMCLSGIRAEETFAFLDVTRLGREYARQDRINNSGKKAEISPARQETGEAGKVYYKSLLNSSIVSPESVTIPAIVKASTGFALVMVMICLPSVMMMCLPCRVIR